MAARRTNDDDRRGLLLRVADLEARVRQLERRLGSLTPKPKVAKKERKGKPAPRCPGCLLELPPGRRGDSCVWCGFRFDAVPPIRPSRRR